MNILIFINYFTPGYKAGGAIRSLSNLIDTIDCKKIKFKVVTLDRDFQDQQSYSLKLDSWLEKSESLDIFYLKSDYKLKYKIYEILRDTSYDLLYINSFFNFNFAILPLFLQSFLIKNSKKTLIAPKGEFSSGALKLKSLKKKLFIIFFEITMTKKNILWHASTTYEDKDIRGLFKLKANDIFIAEDISKLQREKIHFKKNDSKFNICFISRISAKKNLDYAFRVLRKIKKHNITFNIYGPISDMSYWDLCLQEAILLPPNVKYIYHGMVEHSKIQEVYQTNDLLFLPTLGENYGHVFAEAIVYGIPLLISDQTPWRDLCEENLGWDVPLSKPDVFASKINMIAELSRPELDNWKKRIIEKSHKILAIEKKRKQHIKMFNSIANSKL